MNPSNDITAPAAPVRRAGSVHPSLVDIAFNLTLLFLILCTLVAVSARNAVERTLPPIQLAEAKSPEQNSGLTQAKTATVSIREGPEFYLDSKKLSVRDLEQTLKITRPPEVELRGDVRVPYGAITEVLRICQENGITSVALTYKDTAAASN
jgi:biopolymer transport protein ExbD